MANRTPHISDIQRSFASRRTRRLGSMPAVAVVHWLIGLCSFPAARADIGPPVRVRMDFNTVRPAMSGQEYLGVIEVHVGEAGTLDSFELRGHGWSVRSGRGCSMCIPKNMAIARCSHPCSCIDRPCLEPVNSRSLRRICTGCGMTICFWSRPRKCP